MSTGPKAFVASEGYHGQYSRGKPGRQKGGREAYEIEGNVERVYPRVCTTCIIFVPAVGSGDTVLSNALEDRKKERCS